MLSYLFDMPSPHLFQSLSACGEGAKRGGLEGAGRGRQRAGAGKGQLGRLVPEPAGMSDWGATGTLRSW